jgi:putative transposase
MLNGSTQSDLLADIIAAPSQRTVEPAGTNIIVSELNAEGQLKLAVIQSLLEPCDRAAYGQKLRAAAEKLGVSVRSIQRLVKRWEQEGIAGIAQETRADKGSYRIGDFWETFIIKTYKDGNKGSKRMTPKQVAVRVQAKAREIGDEKPPHYRTVLRVLKPIMERQERAEQHS